MSALSLDVPDELIERIAERAAEIMSPLDRYAKDDLHRGCPVCGYWHGTYSLGRGEWAFCREHRLKWMDGSDRVPESVRRETDEQQRARYERLCELYDIDDFADSDDPFREGA